MPGRARGGLGLAYGTPEYMTLGRPEDGWTLRQAERELQVVLREIDLGIWSSLDQSPPSKSR